MGCTDTVSTVGSVPGRRVAPGEETQNRVARWEACRRTNKHTCLQSTVPSDTGAQGSSRYGTHSCRELLALVELRVNMPLSFRLIKQAAWLAMQIPYVCYYYYYFWHQQIFFSPLFFGLLQISCLVLSLYGRCCHTVTKPITSLIGGRAKSQMAKEVTTGDWERN